MTTSKASKITGLFVRYIPNGRLNRYGLFESELPDAQAVLIAHGHNPAEALDKLVEGHYQRVKALVFTEQAYMCGVCGLRGKPMQAHHIRPRSKGRLDIRENLIGLCFSDHEKIERGALLVPHPKLLEKMAGFGLEWIGDYSGPLEPCGWRRADAQMAESRIDV